MRVKFKGLNKKAGTLADKRKVTYYYAWKGGPRIHEEYGSPAFVVAFNDATKNRHSGQKETITSLCRSYIESPDFKIKIGDRSRDDKLEHIEKIESEFGDFPLSALSDLRARTVFLDWRDKLSEKSLRQADYVFQTFARIFSWAKGRGKIPINPLEKIGRLYCGNRVENIWSDADEAAFMRVASKRMQLALTLALWTGQRQEDILALTWGSYDGQYIRLTQGKSKRHGRPPKRVVIPVGAPLKAMLDATPKRSLLVINNFRGVPYTEDGFRNQWGKEFKRSGVTGVTFNDTRGTAVTRLFIAGCTEAEVATITGHTLGQVRSILDAHSFKRDIPLAESAILKLERRTKTPE